VRRIRAGLAGAVVASALAMPDGAWAHAVVGKQDLPIPRWLFAWGAAIVLVVSFVGLATLWPQPRLQRYQERVVATLPRVVEVLCGILGIAAFVLVVYAGFAGVQNAQANLAPTVIFTVLWVGLPFLSAVFGDVFRPFNPWRALARGAGWTAKRVSGRQAMPEPLAYPERLGRWPAVVGLLVFPWVELVYVDRGDPSHLAIMALAYAATQLVGMSLYGVEPWERRGDAFAVYFNLFARLSPLDFRDRRVVVRKPLIAAVRLTPVAGTVALLCTMIGTTSFDGFSQGATWNSLAPHLQRFFIDLGLNAEHALEATGTVGLAAMVSLIFVLYRLGVAGMHTVGEGHTTAELAGRFAHTLIPIALAYVVAHYFSALVYGGQQMAYLVSDPLGNGSDYFGTAGTSVNYNVISATSVWYVQVGALLAGHVCGLMLAHDRAIAMYRSARDATRSQYWMLAVMVAFTSLGLWLLSAANQ
jgi:hypothetical protein